MAGTAAHLVVHVLPAVLYRQWVLSLPRQVRFLLARDGNLLGQMLGVFLRKVFAWPHQHERPIVRVHERPARCLGKQPAPEGAHS